ncbi:MAG: HAD hydrolase-like protein, partial [bacterium]
SKPLPFAQRILERFKLGGRFKGIHGSSLDSADPGKAVLLGALMAEYGLDPAATAMIGDRGQDVVGALAHGVEAVGVLWGYGSREELEAAGARKLLAEPKELVTLLKKV